MVKPKSRSIVRRSKKRPIPLASLRTAEVVRTIVDHPRRLEELVDLLQDKGRTVRGRAATTLARLSESHPRRLTRVLERLGEALGDESAYVRWHLVYTLGKIACAVSLILPQILADLCPQLEDENRIVRAMATKAIGRIACQRPQAVGQFFESNKRSIPPAISRILGRPETKNVPPADK